MSRRNGKARSQTSRALLVALALVAGAARADWREKVDPSLLRELEAASADASAPAPSVEFLVLLHEQADLSGAQAISDKVAKRRFVFETLRDTAARSQASVLSDMRGAGLHPRPFWIANAVLAEGDAAAVAAIASRDDVARITANAKSVTSSPVAEPANDATESVEWNILQIRADAVWALGITGQGVVVAGQDTGYDWDHPALKSKYRGWNGTSVDHAHNWHDAIHSSLGFCGANSPEPCDDDYHGTHTMGTMVGDDGGPNRIGVAPGAKWIGCRNMDHTVGTPATYAECYQWFLAPTDLAGANPDPALAPDVVNNSWACTAGEGCSPETLRIATENLRAAGIFTVQSAGNSGANGCGTVDTPSAIYDAAFSVGNSDATDSLASSSSRGPVTVDSSGRRKPDIVAPGMNIRSAIPGGDYSSTSGTSMAGPHVAGLAALLISAHPALAGNIDAIEELIRESAETNVAANGICGGTTSLEVPNNLFGYGRIDALAAVQLLQSGFIFRDGFESGLADDWSGVETNG